MKSYTLSFSIYLHDKKTSYPEEKPIDISIKENLPVNADAQKYMRARIAEEIARHFAQLAEPIDNKTEDAPADDPLA